MSTHSMRNEHIAHMRDITRQLLDLKANWERLRSDWDGGVSTWLVDASGSDPNDPAYEGNDFTPNHEGLMSADIGAAHTALDTIGTEINVQITNLVKIRNYV